MSTFMMPVALCGMYFLQILLGHRSPEPTDSMIDMCLLMGAAAIVAAALCLLRMRGRQMSIRARFVWAFTILATGIPGLLAFIAVREMTVRVACPSCNGLRRIDRETCPKCAATWPAPKADGSEIFPHSEKDLAATT